MVNCSVRHDDTQHVVVPFDLLVVADYRDARLQTNPSWVVKTGGHGEGGTLRMGGNVPTGQGLFQTNSSCLSLQGYHVPLLKFDPFFTCPSAFWVGQVGSYGKELHFRHSKCS